MGKIWEPSCIKNILSSLEIKIESETHEGLSLAVPPYRVDVKREADVIEEILRIYGYNNVEIPAKVNATLQYRVKPDPVRIRNLMSDLLTAQGFYEIWSNSLTKSSYYDNCTSFPGTNTVKLFNPLSADLNSMRQTLLFGGLEAIAYNANRKNSNLRLYEIGNCYFHKDSELIENPLKNYREEEHLALFVTGKKERENWAVAQADSNFFQLKGFVGHLLSRLGQPAELLKQHDFNTDLIAEGLSYSTFSGKRLVELGIVHNRLRKEFDIDNPVYFADFLLDNLIPGQKNNKITFADIPKYPEVRRDLALLLDKDVSFGQIRDLAVKTERKLLRSVDLFDVYEGKGIPEGKKSYAVSFILRDDDKTLHDNQIEKIIQKLIQVFEKELGAQLR